MRQLFISIFIPISIIIPSELLAQLFGPEIEITQSAYHANDVRSADLDGDGDLDVVFAARDDDKIAWYENNGLGEFGNQRIISILADGAREVYTTDLDNDGDIDVLSASQNDDKIAWYENDGTGEFGPQQIITTLADYAQSVHSADLDGDGDMDVLSASDFDNKIAWYENDGSGGFSEQQIISNLADGAQSVYTADLDGDGDMDVLSASTYYSMIAWYENDGTGVFGPQQVITTLTDYPQSVYSADLDGDGDMDVLSASFSDDKIAWYENDGSGVFGVQEVITTSTNGAQSVYCADLDGDGDMDVLSAADFNNEVAWYENDGLGAFGTEQIITTMAVGAESVYSADLDGDGDMDVLYTSSHTHEIVWNENDGLGGFGSDQVITTVADGASSVFSTDLDGDGDLDVLSASFNDDKVAWYENVGAGAFNAQQVITTLADYVTSVYSTDLDGDGDMDVLSASYSDDKVAWYENDGSGGFGPQQVISTSANGANSVYSEDLDGDGDMDVLSSSFQDDMIAWYENDGLGGFSTEQIISVEAFGASSVFCADIDGDGDMDVLSASDEEGVFGPSKIAWYENDGSGGFGAQQIISSLVDGAHSVYSADLDGDGDMDVLSASSWLTLDKIAWYENDGSGGFGPQLIISTLADFPVSVYSVDFDNDGDMDVLSASSQDQNIAWFENNGLGGFGPLQIIGSLFGASSVYSADIDGDGDMDVMAASSGEDKITWYMNQLGDGCIDPTACNYQPEMWIDNGSCCYSDCGCTILGAENFDDNAVCNDGSCEFQVIGTVFFDENENGLMDSNEYGLPLQEVEFITDTLTLITNNNGQFNASAAGDSQYTFALSASPQFPFFTTPQALLFNASEDNWNQNIFFGVSNEFPEFEIDVNLYPATSSYPCDVFIDHNLSFRNMGNFPIHVVIELAYDTLFQGYNEVSQIDSIGGDTLIYLSFENLLPGEVFFYHIELQTPTAEYLGEMLTSSARIYGYYQNQEVAYGTDSIAIELTCAYDPNDKQVFPAGYTDAHYVPEEEYLEYLVRFQNTGNAPATDVIIRDTIDAGLDISSFELVANSHSVFTTVDPTSREVEFYFQDIQLPDSVNNEPESHGLVSYRILPEEGLPLLTELNNTAYIFFDNNPPIVTNTTWSTIYNCSLFEVEFTQDGAILTASDGDSYQWYLDGEPIDGATAPIFEAFLSGEYAVEISNDFPCSELTSSLFVLVDAIDELANSPISLFPNPMTSSAVLDLGDIKGPFTLEIYDLQGKLVRSEQAIANNNQVTLKRNSLASGSYVLRLNSVEGILDLPFVIR